MEIHALASLSKNKSLVPYSYNKEITSEDVLIKVKYRTLSNSDVLFIDDYWGNTAFPVVPSEDVIGEVIKKGNAVKNLHVGDFVGIGYEVYSCGRCEYCKKGLEQFCQKQRNLRIHEQGGLSDYMIVHHDFAFPIPQELQRPEATPLFCAGLTVYSAIVNNAISKRMKVGVIGIGRLGHLALKFLKSMGCETVAFTGDLTKQNDLKTKGFEVIDLKEELEKFNNSFDCILYTSTIDLNWDDYLKLLKPTGKLCIVGFPQNQISFSAGLLNDYSRRQIVGNFIGSRDDMKMMIAYAAKNNILADVDTFSFNESNKVLGMVKDGGIPYIAVIKS